MGRLTLLGSGGAGGAGGGGGGGGPGTHRYWRINASDNNWGTDNVIAFPEMQLHIGANGFGLDAANGGTASADTELSGGTTAAKAFDNLFAPASGIWASTNTAFPHWLKYDFGSGNDKEVRGVSILARDSSFAGQAPGTFTLEYSDNNSTWTSALSVSGATWVDCEHKHFLTAGVTSYSGSPHGTHRYWRIFTLIWDGGGLSSATEIEFRATPGGADQASGGTATEGAHTGGLVAANAFDNNTATFFAGVGTPADAWVGYDFGVGNAVSVGQVMWRNRSDGFANQAPAAALIQYSDDGTTYTTAWGFTGSTGWSLGETRTYTDPNYV